MSSETATFLYGAYVLLGVLHIIYGLTLQARRKALREEFDLLKERTKRAAE